MSENLNKCLDKLKFIASIKEDKLREKVLVSLSDECLYKALYEIANNFRKGNIKLKTHKKRKLEKFDNIFKKFKKNNKKTQKIRLIKQSGGWLPIILPAVASIIASLVN